MVVIRFYETERRERQVRCVGIILEKKREREREKTQTQMPKKAEKKCNK